MDPTAIVETSIDEIDLEIVDLSDGDYPRNAVPTTCTDVSCTVTDPTPPPYHGTSCHQQTLDKMLEASKR